VHEALPRFEDLVFGGHELTDASLLKRAELLVDEGVVPPSLPAAVAKSLNQANANIRPGISMEGPSRRPMEAIQRVPEDLHSFHSDLGARDVRVRANGVLHQFTVRLRSHRLGVPLVDFTSSPGARLPALQALARERAAPHAGRDGKTGETLVKSTPRRYSPAAPYGCAPGRV
jgi:myo-inositol-1-phosphate synthase